MERLFINSKIIIFCLIICLLIPLGAASASDVNNTAADDQVLSATPNVDTISANVNNGENSNDTLSVNDEKNILSAGLESGSNNLLGDASENTRTFSDLNDLIKLSSDRIIFSNDYKYDSQNDSSFVNGITISKAIEIDGNKHIMDASKTASFFNIKSDNVIIKNIIFINFKPTNGITVLGNNVTLDNVVFCNSSGLTKNLLVVYGEYCTMKNSIIDNIKVNKHNTDDFAFVIYSNHFTFDNTTFKHSVFSKFAILFEFTSSDSKLDSCTFYDIDFGSKGNGNFGFVIFARRTDVSFDNCNFTNVHLTQTGTGERAIISYGFGKLNMTNTTMENCSINANTPSSYALVGWSSSSYAYIYNCTFKNNNNTRNNHVIRANPMCDIIKCTFENNNNAISLAGKGVNIINSTFTKNKNVIKGDYEFTNVENCTFDSNNPSNAVIDISANKTIIKKCTFNDNNNTCIDLYGFNGNVIGPTFNGNVKDTNGTIESFESYPEIYVSQDGEALDSIHIWTTLENAIKSINFNGKIYLAKGIYSLGNNILSVPASLIGLKKGDVILNNTSFDTADIINNEIINITFNNTKNAFTVAFGSTFNNCIFTNTSNLNFGDDIAFFSIVNSKFDNVNTTDSLTGNSARNVHNTFENLTFNKFKGFITGASTFVHNLFKNITIDNSQFYGFQKSNPREHVNNRFIDINITNCEGVNGNTFIRLSNNYLDNYMAKTNMINNLLIENMTNTKENTFLAINGANVNKFTIKNLTKDSTVVLISVYNTPAVLSNITFSLINHTSTNNMINFNKEMDYKIDGLTLNNVNTTSNIIPSYDNTELNRLIINTVNITSKDKILFTLKDNSILKNSNFNNFTGHVVVNGDNVVIQHSKFSFANNSNLNGSCIILNTGSDMFKALYCNFTSNNASNGTIYVSSECKRPIFNNCNFTDNTAKYNGGALYIVSTPTDRITAGINPTTNKTILYPGQTGYVNVGYNDFWGYLEDTYSVLYLINNTTGWYPGEDNNYDGHSFESPTSDLTKLFNLIDGAIVYFVRYGDIFTSTMGHFSYSADFEDVAFYGNNTILIDMGFVISNNNMKVYNITFKDYPKTAIIVNGSDCLFDNCSFVNIGGMDSIYGGAMQINANNTVITNSNFINCDALHETEGLGDGYGGALFINGSNTKVDNCHFEKNTVNYDGSHVYINEGLNNVSLTNNNFTFGNIVGSGHGSGVVVQGTNVHVDNNNFTNNTGQIGSAMSIIGDVTLLTVNNNNYTNNSALQNGALYLAFTNSFGQSIEITGNDFTNNSAVNGGALFVDPSDLRALTMNHNDFTNNSAVNGGAVYINCPGFVLSDGVLKNNGATVGGAVYVNATNVLFKNLELTGNKAVKEDSMGSAIYVADEVVCDFDNVKLNYNEVFGGNDTATTGGLRGDIYFADVVSGSIDNVVFGDEPYKQYYAVNTMYRGMTIYVNLTGTGRGLSETDTRSDLTTALNHIAPNGIIYFMDDEEFEITLDIYNQIKDANLINVSFVGVGNKILKKANDNPDKYLFNHPKKIKNLSLNNYLSTKTQKNKN